MKLNIGKAIHEANPKLCWVLILKVELDTSIEEYVVATIPVEFLGLDDGMTRFARVLVECEIAIKQSQYFWEDVHSLWIPQDGYSRDKDIPVVPFEWLQNLPSFYLDDNTYPGLPIDVTLKYFDETGLEYEASFEFSDAMTKEVMDYKPVTYEDVYGAEYE